MRGNGWATDVSSAQAECSDNSRAVNAGASCGADDLRIAAEIAISEGSGTGGRYIDDALAAQLQIPEETVSFAGVLFLEGA